MTPSSPIQQGRSRFSPGDRTRGRERCKISSVRPSTRKQHPWALSSPATRRTFVRRNCVPMSGKAPRTHSQVDLELPLLTSRPEHGEAPRLHHALRSAPPLAPATSQGGPRSGRPRQQPPSHTHQIHDRGASPPTSTTTLRNPRVLLLPGRARI